jgi:hypothetical protein
MTVVGGLIDDGLLAGFTVHNEDRMTSLIGDGAEEILQINKGGSHAHCPGATATAHTLYGFCAGIEGVGDFSVKVRMKADPDAGWGGGGVGAWRYPTSGQDYRHIISGANTTNHHAHSTVENTVFLNVNGSAVDETSFLWYEVKRVGELISCGTSADNETWDYAPFDEQDRDILGNQVFIGVMAGKYNGGPDTIDIVMTDLILTYTAPG